MKDKIVFTGGGSAGHIVPNFPLIEAMQKKGFEVDYIGQKASMEAELISRLNIPFHGIHSGKLRRYMSVKNFSDPFKVLLGIFEAWKILGRLQPKLVFSKGGFVSFPVVLAAWFRRIPVIAHESDLTPGLANRLSYPFVQKTCLTFSHAQTHFKDKTRVEVTGTPIREILFQGSREEGLRLCHFKDEKPCLLVIGGSQGAQNLNRLIRDMLPELIKTFQVIHLCGKGKVLPDLNSENYYQFEYIDEEMRDLYAASDLLISRAGANTLYEILALGKPHILIPASTQGSRGDQIQNARFFEKQGVSTVLNEETLTSLQFLNAVKEAWEKREEVTEKIKALQIKSGTSSIIQLFQKILDSKTKA